MVNRLSCALACFAAAARRSVLAIAAMLAAAGIYAVAAHADVQKGGTPVKHRPVHGPGSTHNPIVHHPPLHGPGSTHDPIVRYPHRHRAGPHHHVIHHTKSPALRCDPPPCPVRR